MVFIQDTQNIFSILNSMKILQQTKFSNPSDQPTDSLEPHQQHLSTTMHQQHINNGGYQQQHDWNSSPSDVCTNVYGQLTTLHPQQHHHQQQQSHSSWTNHNEGQETYASNYPFNGGGGGDMCEYGNQWPQQQQTNNFLLQLQNRVNGYNNPYSTAQSNYAGNLSSNFFL